MRFDNPENEELLQEIISRRPSIPDDTFSIEPQELVLNISEGCNLTCPYCFANAGQYSATSASWMEADVSYNTTSLMLKHFPSISTIKFFWR